MKITSIETIILRKEVKNPVKTLCIHTMQAVINKIRRVEFIWNILH
jgi:hypothetical protein